MSMTEQVLIDNNGKAIAVQIPISQYKKIKERLEELDDIKAFDKAMSKKLVFTDFKDAVKKIKSSRKSK